MRGRFLGFSFQRVAVVLLLLVLFAPVGAAGAGVTLRGYAEAGADMYEYVLFGYYPQSKGGGESGSNKGSDYVTLEGENYRIEPIAWRVLSVDAASATPRRALLLSDMVLDASAFGSDDKYDKSHVRTLLVGSHDIGEGGIFHNKDANNLKEEAYFKEAERAAVSPDSIETTTNPLFLMTDEAVKDEKIFGKTVVVADNRKAKPTAYALAKSADQPGDFWPWWTRSPGSDDNHVAVVRSDGTLGEVSSDVSKVGVRPALFLNLESVIFKSVSDVSKPAAEGGSSSNPYVLYVTSRDEGLTPRASVDGNQLTVSFDVMIAHAYRDVVSTDALAKKFVASLDETLLTVTSATVTGGKLVLTLNKTFVYNEDAKGLDIAYLGLELGDTDGIGVPAKRTAIKSLGLQSGLGKVTNRTQPSPGDDGGGDDGGGDDGGQSGANTPLAVIGVVSDDRDHPAAEHKAQIQPDGVYLITLPEGTDPSILESLYLKVALPAGATISPGMPAAFDFTDPENKPVKLTITAEDGTKRTVVVRARIAQPEVAAGTVVEGDPSRCSVIVTYDDAAQAAGKSARAGGTLTVEARMPFADTFDPAKLDGLSAKLSGLTNLSFAYVDANGSAAPLTARAAGDPYLRIKGTAAGESALAAAALSELTFWLKGDNTEYRQTFGPALKFSDMPTTYTNERPDEEREEETSSGSGGCDAGFGVFALLALGMAIKRRR